MVTPTPYQVSAEEGKGAEEARRGRKRVASEGQEGKPSKKGKTPSTGGLGRASDVDVELCDEDKPLAKPYVQQGTLMIPPSFLITEVILRHTYVLAGQRLVFPNRPPLR